MSVQTKRWTRAEYERMVELGLLAPDSHVQLIDGEILQMAPPGAPHSTAVGHVQDALHAIFQGTAFHVRVQQPILIGDHSVPEPDVAVVKGQRSDYHDTHPAASDVVLAVEVSDTSIELDRRRKARLYSRAGIPEYWIVEIQACILEVFTGPGAAGYERRVALPPGDTVSPTAKPDAKINVASLLP
ncbi:MAG: Uma2 family endonuclease [bacterium]